MCRSWVNQASITKEQLAPLEIPLPSLDEQQRIAAILDKADDLRRKRRRAIELLDGLTQVLFLEMFGDPILNARGYRTRRLIDLVERDRGISYGIVQRGDDQEVGVKVLRIFDFEDGVVIDTNIKKTTAEIASRFRRTSLKGGEIVISIRGTVGRCASIPASLSGANVSREVAVIPTLEPNKNAFYLSVLRTDAAQRRLSSDVKGIAQRGINLEDLRELPIIQPPKEELAKFDAAQERLAAVVSGSQSQNCHLDSLFSSLQSRAFSGQL